MQLIDQSVLNTVSGGMATMRNGRVIVTGNSTLSLNDLVFTSTAVCAPAGCTDEIFIRPVDYSLSFYYNGKDTATIVGQKFGVDGAEYVLL